MTARRVAERLQDVPISITVFNQQQLQQRNITTATQLATYTPSLSAANQWGDDNTSFALRGFSQQLQTSPTVGVYFADVVAPRGGPVLQSGDAAGPGDFFDLENLQVLKGPQGTLFGRNTTGGAVLIVPVKPSHHYEGYAEATVGNLDLRQLQAVVNLPVSETFRLRLGVDRKTREGYMHNLSGIGPSRFANTDYTAFRASAVWDVTPSLENYTIFSYTSSKNAGPSEQIFQCQAGEVLSSFACPLVAAQNAAGKYSMNNNLFDAHTSLHKFQVINTTTWDAADWLTIKNIASYAELKTNTTNNLFGDDFNLPSSLPAPLGGANVWFTTVGSPPGSDLANQSTFTEELQFQGHSLNDRLTWQAGGYFEFSRPIGPNHNVSPLLISCANPYTLQCTDVLGILFGAPGFVGAVNDKPDAIQYRNIAAYAQASYKISDQWKITGGLRYTSDHTSSWARQTSYTFPLGVAPVPHCVSIFTTLADGCFLGLKQKSAKPTWLIDVDYTPVEDVLLYAKYARGYRQGDINAVGADGYNTWGPETVDSYEVGAKTSFRGPVPGALDVAAFYNKFNNQQIFATFQGPPPVSLSNSIINAGRSRIWGFEVEATAEPVRNLTLAVGYTYLNSRIESLKPVIPIPATGYTIIQYGSNVGDPMQFTPRNKATASVDYTLPLDEKYGKISLGATYVYTDPQLVISGSPLGYIPATNLLSLHADWNSFAGKPVDISLFMTNVTNKFYWTNVTDILPTVGFAERTLGEPRMYGVRVRARFGS